MIVVYYSEIIASLFVGALCMFLYIYKTRKTDVFFFPDTMMPCNSFYKQMLGDRGFRCRRPNCEYAHYNENNLTSLMEIVLCLSKATHKIDLCVFEFTQSHLADFLISLYKKGIQVRIITDAHRDRKKNNDNSGDQKQQQGINNQIPKLQHARIQVKVNRMAHLGSVSDKERAKMHNKFVLVDDSHMIMGSFNWTQNAVIWNHEAVISTNESRVVKKFVRKFEDIWNACEDRERELPVIRIR